MTRFYFPRHFSRIVPEISDSIRRIRFEAKFRRQLKAVSQVFSCTSLYDAALAHSIARPIMMAEGEAKSADDAATADDAEVPEPQLWLPATEVGTTPLPPLSTLSIC